MKTADELRDEAIARVEAHARKVWLDAARDAMEEVAAIRGQGGLFTTDPVWALLDKRGVPSPHEPRAMGPVVKGAVTDGLMEFTGGFTTSTIPRGHRRPVRIYRVL